MPSESIRSDLFLERTLTRRVLDVVSPAGRILGAFAAHRPAHIGDYVDLGEAVANCSHAARAVHSPAYVFALEHFGHVRISVAGDADTLTFTLEEFVALATWTPPAAPSK